MPVGTPKKKFRPGGLAPITGIYAVHHGIHHRDKHEVVIIRGEDLPSCRICKMNIWFEMLRPISHITHDWDFSGPTNLVVMLRGDDFKDFRIFHRGQVELPIKLQLSASPRGEVIEGRTKDLSAGGLGAIIRKDIPDRFRTEIVKIAIKREGTAMNVLARLRYQQGVRYGFEFVHLNPSEQEDLRRIIARRKTRIEAMAN